MADNALSVLFGEIAGAIRTKTGAPDDDRMAPAEFPERIMEITTGGGSVEGVHFVTFMSEDGITELYKRPVADGDTCADPVARGLLETPTKESTAQYNYTHSGWAGSVGGSADSSILNAVTADKTVYAAFTASTRYYTITWLDDDGSVLKTESLAYGATPSYKPEKEGYGFGGWEPAVTTVTGDINYTAIWTEKLSFANASWADIARVSEAGEAELHFALGDRKEISFKGPDNKSYTMDCQIIGFAHDTCADGTKAGITMRICKSAGVVAVHSSTVNIGWNSFKIRTTLNSTTLGSLPETLQAVIKSVAKKYNSYASDGTTQTTGTVNDKLWLLSVNELGGSKSTNDGTRYAYFGQNQSNKYLDDQKTSSSYSFRTRSRATGGNVWSLRQDGQWVGSALESAQNISFGFCV